MDSGKERVLGTLQYAVAGLLLVFLSYCLHFNFDVTDEGFYLYYYRWGSAVASFNFYHIFLSPLGSVFGHKLIFYRYLSVIALGLIPFLFVAKTPRHYLLGLCFSLFYFNQLATFSYNTLSLLSLAGILSVLLVWKERREKLLLAGVVGLLAFLVFSARLIPGVLALMTAVIFFIMEKGERKPLLFCLLCFFLPLGITFIFWNEGWELTQLYVSAIRLSSHQDIVSKYFIHGSEYVLKSVAVPLLILFLSRRFLPRQQVPLHIAYFLWIFYRKFLLESDATGFGYYFSGYLLATGLLNLRKDNLALILLPLNLYFISALGTNNNLFKSSSYNLLLLFPLVLYFLRNQREIFITGATLAGVLTAGLSLYRNQYAKTYRNLPRSQQTMVKSHFHMLESIVIDRKYEEKLAGIENRLREERFDPLRDRLVTYPNMPGVVSVLGARALGGPWNNSSYAGSLETSCALISSDVWKEGRVFIVTSETLPAELLSCISSSTRQLVYVTVDKFR